MATLFIADLHLSNQEPAITAGFLRFLRQQAVNADALYILGDLFEMWIGDDEPNPLHDEVANAIRTLSDGGVPVYFIQGNRDFLLGRSRGKANYAARCGMTLLDDEMVLNLYQRPVLILHGDTLCTDDIDYLNFRRKVHNRFLQRLFLWLPLSLRQKIGVKLRAKSSATNEIKSWDIMDVNPETVKSRFQQHKLLTMIHGHTHRPAIHQVVLDNNKIAQRAVLGAWHEQGSMIKVTENEVTLEQFPF